MARRTIAAPGSVPPDTSGDPPTRVTKSLIGCGVVAGPVFVLVSGIQALTREGFDPTRHAWSLLSNGSLGWIQITNFVLTGLMVAALAVGLRRALPPGRGSTWAPRLIGAYGVGLVAAGVFRADPALGFPPGTPPDAREVSWHGMVHFASAGIGFACLIAACLVIARRFAAEGHRGWATFSRVTGVVFLAGFLGIASGGANAWTTLGFIAAEALAWAWLSALAVRFYRRAQN